MWTFLMVVGRDRAPEAVPVTRPEDQELIEARPV